MSCFARGHDVWDGVPGIPRCQEAELAELRRARAELEMEAG